MDVVVVNYRTTDLLSRFLNSFSTINGYNTKAHKCIVVDNDPLENDAPSRDVDFKYLPNDENIGYARACNMGFATSDSDFVVLCNSDIEFADRSTLDYCEYYMENNHDCGVLGVRQLAFKRGSEVITDDGFILDGDTVVHRNWMEIRSSVQPPVTGPVHRIMGSFMVVRREFANKVLADENFLAMWPDAEGPMPEHKLYFEDTALCYAARNFGYTVDFLSERYVRHSWHGTIDRYGDGGAYDQSKRDFENLIHGWGMVNYE